MADHTINTFLNPSIGIQELLQMPEDNRLPQARELGASLLQETGLEGLYGAVNSHTAFEALLCPNVGDGTLVSPEVFSSQLESLVKKLSESRNPPFRMSAAFFRQSLILTARFEEGAVTAALLENALRVLSDEIERA